MIILGLVLTRGEKTRTKPTRFGSVRVGLDFNSIVTELNQIELGRFGSNVKQNLKLKLNPSSLFVRLPGLSSSSVPRSFSVRGSSIFRLMLTCSQMPKFCSNLRSEKLKLFKPQNDVYDLQLTSVKNNTELKKLLIALLVNRRRKKKTKEKGEETEEKIKDKDEGKKEKMKKKVEEKK